MTAEIVDPRTAMGILRAHQARIGKPRNRIHYETMGDTANRMRALEGICGSCTRLVLELKKDNPGKQIVQLRCLAGYSPLELYINTDLGQKPVCPGLRLRLS